MQQRRDIPKRGVAFSSFMPVKQAESAGGAHSVSVRYFTDLDGKQKKGYYKPLDLRQGPTYYPEFLAKIAVMASIFCRIMLGDKAAEDRLVFDDNGNVIGTISLHLDGSTFCYNGETPTNSEEQIPSTETLLKNFFIEILLANYIFSNDDGHPHNLGLRKIFDYDNFFCILSDIVKGRRPLDNWGGLYDINPEKAYTTRNDYANFPIVSEGYCTHHPTYTVPGNFNFIDKQYPNPEAFRALAGNPKIKIDGKEVSAQEQLGIATLKFLLTRQHGRMECILNDYFGDIPLNYTELPEHKKKKLEEIAPELFNSTTNEKPFRIFSKTYHDFIYDCFYRTAVYFEGVKANTRGVPVPSFNDQLSARPGMYHEVIQWMSEQNKKMEVLGLHGTSTLSELPASPFAGWNYDKDIARTTYQRVHRDAYATEMKSLWKEVQSDINILLRDLGSKYPEFVVVHDIESLDLKLKKSIDFFGHPEYKKLELVDQTIKCEKDHTLRIAVNKMVKIHQKWYDILCEYYSKDNPTEEDAVIFQENLGKLYTEFIKQVLLKVGSSVSWTQAWTKSMNALENLRGRMCFTTHLTEVVVFPERMPVKLQDYRHPDTVTACISALFKWLKDYKDLDIYLEIAVGKYKEQAYLALLSNRIPKVMNYIHSSKAVSGDIRVAHILCAPNHEQGTMNEAIIQVLLRQMLESSTYLLSGEFKEVWDALQTQKSPFDIKLYANAAVKFCKEQYPQQQDVVRGDVSFREMNTYLMYWITNTFNANRSQFEKLFNEANDAYQKRGYVQKFFSNRPVKHIDFHGTSMQILIDTIFFGGGWEDTSLNTQIYNQLITKLILTGKETGCTDGEFLSLCNTINHPQGMKSLREDMMKMINEMHQPAKTSSRPMKMLPAPGY